jgi:hypothetical protein
MDLELLIWVSYSVLAHLFIGMMLKLVGLPLASGTTFTTPSITATTTYYAAAYTSSTGNITLGAGGTSSNGNCCKFSSMVHGRN